MTVSRLEIPDKDVPERLTRRSDFLAMRGGARFHARAFVLQARRRQPGETRHEAARFGYTVTKRVGNSVERNRIRRRLREAVRRSAPGHALPGYDYVLVAKREALDAPFTSIVAQLAEGLDRTARLRANPHKSRPGRGAKPADSAGNDGRDTGA